VLLVMGQFDTRAGKPKPLTAAGGQARVPRKETVLRRQDGQLKDRTSEEKTQLAEIKSLHPQGKKTST